ncbi:MAG: hypothetical protein V3V72_04205 [Ignavibacteriaceae bacterium]|jgi:hypothetical protein
MPIEKISENLVLKPEDKLMRVKIKANKTRAATRKDKIKIKLTGKLVAVVNLPIVSNEINLALIRNLIDTKNKMKKIKFLWSE